jgi:hypothetical protein
VLELLTNVQGLRSDHVWVELRAEALQVYDIVPDGIKPRSSCRIAEAVIRKLSETSFEIADESLTLAFSCISMDQSSNWINNIKHAKLNFWKIQQANPTRVVPRVKKDELPVIAPTAIQQTQSLPQLPFRPTSKTISMLIDGPAAPVASKDATHEGFLFRLERDKKTWNRYYSILVPPTLWLYKCDHVSKIYFKLLFP